MMCTVEALSTKPSAPAVREVHLLGAARDAVGDWTLLATGVRKRVHNYHSKRDKVLRFFYATVEGGDVAAGFAGISSKRLTIENIDVTGAVGGHSDYCTSLSLK